MAAQISANAYLSWRIADVVLKNNLGSAYKGLTQTDPSLITTALSESATKSGVTTLK
jgi:hypothetical protein